MRFATKILMPIALALAVLAVVAGCGSGSSSGSSTPSSSSAANAKVYKIGVTQIVTHPALDGAIQGFKQALAAKGIQTTYDMQNAEGNMATAAQIAQKFAGEKLDLILGVATPTTQAVVKAITNTPIVFTAVTDPKGAGIVTDPAAPSGNVTGVSDMLPVQPHLDLIKAIVPNVKTIGVLYNAGEANSVFLIKAEKAAAAKMGIKVIDATASSSSEVQAAAQSLVGRVDAMSVLTDNTVVSALDSVVKIADQNHIPLIAGDTDSVKGGAVAAYAFNYKDLGYQTGEMAAKILTGTPISSLPVEFAKNLQLAINQKAAAAQGVTLPAAIVAKATLKY
jgi:putative tryptophan/tyrosine transport system substrate-binding protein